MDWWVNNPCFSREASRKNLDDSLVRIEQRLQKLEEAPAKKSQPGGIAMVRINSSFNASVA